MPQRWIVLAACSTTLALATVPARAAAQGMPGLATKAADPHGLYVHGHVEGVQFNPDADDAEAGDTEYGYGAGVQVGYNFTRYLGAFVGFDYARHGAEGGTVDDPEGGFTLEVDDQARFTHLEAGGRLNVPIGQRVLPYLDVAYARRVVKQDFSVDAGFEGGDGTVELRGDNVLVGLGFQFFLRPDVAFDLGGRLSAGDFNEAKVTFAGDSQSSDEDLDASARLARLTAGLTWYPGGGRR